MDSLQTPPNPYAPSAPPTLPGALPQYQPATKWPTVLGMIGIVFGILAALQAVWGAVSFTFMRGFMPPEMTQQFERLQGWTVISSLVTLAPAILLLVVGIGLSSRRRWGVSFSKIWAILKIVVVLVNVTVGWQIQKAVFQSNPALATGGGPAAAMIRLQGVATAVTVAWLCALPVFMLIWFSRETIKAEVATWR